MSTPLSSATQKVRDAAMDAQAGHEYCQYRQIAAAVLRAAVEQAAPVSTNLRQTEVRRELLAIATELENHQ